MVPFMAPVVINFNSSLPIDASMFPYPAKVFCTSCNAERQTITQTTPGAGTWIACLLLGFTVGCCCIPFFIESCNDKIHTCCYCRR
jgi:hypothetical protein